MKNLFACVLLLFFVASGFQTAECFQKRRPAAKRTARPELPTQNNRSNQSAAQTEQTPDERFNATIAAFDAFTVELVGRIEKARNPTSGINAGQKYMNMRKAEMKDRFAGIRCIPEAQVSDDVERKVKEHLYNDGVMVGQLLPKYGSNPVVKAKIQKLIDDFLDIFKYSSPCPKNSLARLFRTQTFKSL
jgi:hypothetical protein